MKKILILVFMLIGFWGYSQKVGDATIKTYGDTYLNTNNTGSITGAMLNTYLNYMISSKVNHDSATVVRIAATKDTLFITYWGFSEDTIPLGAGTGYWTLGGAGTTLYPDSLDYLVGIGTTTPGTSLDVVDETTDSDMLWLRKYNTSVAASPNIDFYKYNGTTSSYAAITDGTVLSDIEWNASYNASNTGMGAKIMVQATQAWTSTNRGTWMVFHTTENDSTTAAASMTIDEHANVEVPYGDVIVREGWRTWVPVLTWTGGAITGATVVARYQTINETVTFELDISGTNASGTTTTALKVSLPETPDDINAFDPVTCLYSGSIKAAGPAGFLAAFIDMNDNTGTNRILYTSTFSIINGNDYRFIFSGDYEITGD